MMVQVARGKRKYFTDEEFRETLRKNTIYYPNAKLEIKDYHYKCTNSTYNGEWRGGFRQGYGVMKWPDGAMYEGTFDFGRANGQGKFTHLKGEIYEG